MRHLADIRDGNGSKRNKSFPCSKKEDSAVFRRLLVVKPMPTVYRYKGFRLHFYSDEGHEPPHIHVPRGDDACKF
jgi:hypothetical protein